MAADSGPVACGTGNSRLMLGSSASNCGKGAARQVALKSVALAPTWTGMAWAVLLAQV